MLVYVLISRGSYKRVERVFLVLSVVYVVYIVSGLLAHPAWPTALRATVMPSFSPTTAFMLAAVGLVGTTVTPWGQFFIQAYVVDKGIAARQAQLRARRRLLRRLHHRLRRLLHHRGHRRHPLHATACATSPRQARRPGAATAGGAFRRDPLRPRVVKRLAAGRLRAAASTAYPICEAMGFEMGVDKPVRQAPVFYGIFAFCILFGALVVLLPGASLIAILFFSAVLNGVLLAPLLIYLYVIANDEAIMGSIPTGGSPTSSPWPRSSCFGLTACCFAAAFHLL